jgi:molybdopterin converting factor small subunit
LLVPLAAGRRGHPVILPWDLARSISGLPEGKGINTLLANSPERLVEMELSLPDLADDLDTPEDLRRWRARLGTLLTVRLFAAAKERAGGATIDIDLTLPATVADLRRAIALQHPSLAPLAHGVTIAVDSEYASDATRIGAGAQVALIPPVSGG